MLFEEKYPNANYTDWYENGNYMCARIPGHCYICGKITRFVELNAEAYICSEESDKTFYDGMASYTN
jgi:hypothetical protein